VTDTFKKLYQGQPGTGAAALYTCPAATTAIIRHIRVVNNDTQARLITLWDGGSADSNAILPATSVPKGGVLELDVFVVVGAGVAIQGKADAAAKVTVTMYGVEIT
jgi:hypothetical protein